MTRRISSRLLELGLVLLAVGGSSVAAVGPQYVYNRSNFVTGKYPSAVAIADVNGDKRPDLIITNQVDGTVSVLVGSWNGIFGAHKDFATASVPVALVAADFNHDGKIDLAVAAVSGSLSILIGNGDGTFQPHVDYPVSGGPLSLAVGDFNQDGNLDLAILGSSVSIFFGKGDGTFEHNADYPVGTAPTDLVAHDLNGDGHLDLVVANSGGNFLSVLLGNADGTFNSAPDVPTQSGPGAVTVADFNGDKVPDLAVTHQDAPWSLTVLKGNGDGTFQTEQQVTTLVDTYQLQSLDLNRDGKADIVLTLVSSGGVLVFLGNGDGSFQSPVTYTTGTYPTGFAIADLNGDEELDVAVTDEYGNDVTVLLGNGEGTFNPRIGLPAAPPGISQPYAATSAIGDFNGDGIPDIAIAEWDPDYLSGGVLVMLGKGKGMFASPIFTDSKGADQIATGDFNEDGHLDVAVANADGAAILLGNGDGTFGIPLQVLTTVADPARGVVAADFNNDGHLDLAVLGNGFLQAEPLYVFLGKGDGTFQPALQSWTLSSIPIAITSADLNRDGKMDLVVTVNPNGIAVMLGKGDGTFQPPVIYATDELPNGLTIADVNDDGILDVLATGTLLDIFLGRGDGTFAQAVDVPAGNFPAQVVTGDFNGDGKLDIAVAAEGRSLGDLEILLGDGTGKFQPPVEISSPAAWASGPLTVGDLNQDGTLDLVVGGQTGSLFLSSPLATLSPTVINFGTVKVGTTSTAHTVALANNGNAPLRLSAVRTTAGYHVVSKCGGTVAPRSGCALQVTFAPTTKGNSKGTLSLTDNASGSLQRVMLSGRGD